MCVPPRVTLITTCHLPLTNPSPFSYSPSTPTSFYSSSEHFSLPIQLMLQRLKRWELLNGKNTAPNWVRLILNSWRWFKYLCVRFNMLSQRNWCLIRFLWFSQLNLSNVLNVLKVPHFNLCNVLWHNNINMFGGTFPLLLSFHSGIGMLMYFIVFFIGTICSASTSHTPSNEQSSLITGE